MLPASLLSSFTFQLFINNTSDLKKKLQELEELLSFFKSPVAYILFLFSVYLFIIHVENFSTILVILSCIFKNDTLKKHLGVSGIEAYGLADFPLR